MRACRNEARGIDLRRVLPFQSIGADGDGLALGLLGELVTGLSRNRDFFVIATGTSMAYAERQPKLSEVSRELGVRYAVTGRVQQAGVRLRVTAELSDATMNHVVWADSWDREMQDVFAVQDEMAQAISAQIQPQLTRQEVHRAKARQSSRSMPGNGSSGAALQLEDRLAARRDRGAHRIGGGLSGLRRSALLAARLAYQVWFGDLSRFADVHHASEAERMAEDNANVSVMAAIVFSHLGKAIIVAARRALSINPNLPDLGVQRLVRRHGRWPGGRRSPDRAGLSIESEGSDALRVAAVREQLPHSRDFPNALRSIDESIAVNRRWFLAHTFKAVARHAR